MTNASGPVLAKNYGHIETERSEQSGFANFAKRLLGLYRNRASSGPMLHSDATDTELVDAFTVMSIVHERLDDTVLKP